MLPLTRLPDLPGLSDYAEGETPRRRLNDLDCNNEPTLRSALEEAAKKTAQRYAHGNLAEEEYRKDFLGKKIGKFSVSGRIIREIPKGTFTMTHKPTAQTTPAAISIQTTFDSNSAANSGIRLYLTSNANTFQLERVMGGNYQPASDQNHINTYLPAALAFIQELSNITGGEYTIDARSCIQHYAQWNRGKLPQLEQEIHIKPKVDITTMARKQISDAMKNSDPV
ncbi:MAG: hypothetical protein NTX63_04530 [Candidatus Peregrinibacteria bacterium]|nr:hypothetical protein [Candidatus Peregrinibacteria bacterium]